MSFIYVVLENSDQEPPGGGLYPNAFKTFEEAKAFAIGKFQDELDRQMEEIGDNSVMEYVDVPESVTGITNMYIEKGIYIYIHKISVKFSGGKRSFFAKSATRKRKMKRRNYSM